MQRAGYVPSLKLQVGLAKMGGLESDQERRFRIGRLPAWLTAQQPKEGNAPLASIAYCRRPECVYDPAGLRQLVVLAHC